MGVGRDGGRGDATLNGYVFKVPVFNGLLLVYRNKIL